jgi:hypothetical protein
VAQVAQVEVVRRGDGMDEGLMVDASGCERRVLFEGVMKCSFVVAGKAMAKI